MVSGGIHSPYTKPAKVTGLERTEAVSEVFFWCILWLSAYWSSVTQSVESVGPTPPDYPVAFRASSSSGRLGVMALRS